MKELQKKLVVELWEFKKEIILKIDMILKIIL